MDAGGAPDGRLASGWTWASQTRAVRKSSPKAAIFALASDLHRVVLQHPERRDRQGLLVGRFQHHLRREAGVEGFLPARGAEAPAVAGLEAREAVLRHRGGEVVAGG